MKKCLYNTIEDFVDICTKKKIIKNNKHKKIKNKIKNNNTKIEDDAGFCSTVDVDACQKKKENGTIQTNWNFDNI